MNALRAKDRHPSFGAIYSRLHDVVPPARFAQALEALGYDAVWATEGLVNQQATLDPVVSMAGLAHGSRRLVVGSCVILLPLRNPAILAKQIASLDQLARGRLVVGVGVGGSAMSQPADFRAVGVDPRERGARTDEAIAVMRALWGGEPVVHRGRFWSFDHVRMLPAPMPVPPVWAGGNAEGVLRRAGRCCEGFVPMGPGAAGYRRLWDRVRIHAERAGRDPGAITRAVHIYIRVDASAAAARAAAERTLAERYGIDVRLPGAGEFAFGTPEGCAAVLQEYVQAGVQHFVLNPVRALAEIPAEFERIAAEVIPLLR